MDDLEDDVAHLADRLTRLRGRLTGGLRNRQPETDTEQETDLATDSLEHSLGAGFRFRRGA